jgi:hypothetical protein
VAVVEFRECFRLLKTHIRVLDLSSQPYPVNQYPSVLSLRVLVPMTRLALKRNQINPTNPFLPRLEIHPRASATS